MKIKILEVDFMEIDCSDVFEIEQNFENEYIAIKNININNEDIYLNISSGDKMSDDIKWIEV